MLRFIPVHLCRAHKTNEQKASQYFNLLQSGTVFPPIEVMECDGLFYVLDGAHRLKAHENEEEILAFVFDSNDCPGKSRLGSRGPKTKK